MNRFGKALMGAAIASMLALAGCGTTASDRAISGGLIGAAGGAAIGSVTGSAGKGAVIGGVAGAAAGGLTTPDQIDGGKPVWRKRCVAYYNNGKCKRYE